MAGYYPFNKDATDDARNLRTALDQLRSGREGLRRALASMNQSTNQQIADRWGVYPTTSGGADQVAQSTALKAELASCMAQVEGGAVLAAIDQLFAKTG
jgi:hypothetical protein